MSFARMKRKAGPHSNGSGSAHEVRVRVRGGYLPDTVYARAGAPIHIVFRREESVACSEQVVFPAFGKSATLPEGEDVAVEFPPAEPGAYEFTCAMGMLRGRLLVSSEQRPSLSSAAPKPPAQAGSERS